MQEKKKVGTGVGVILQMNGKILMGKRNADKTRAGSAFGSVGEWTLPGGKQEWNETFEEAGVREVLEETGIHIKNIEVVSVHNHKNGHAHFVTIGLVAKDWEGDAKVMEPDEINEWQWFDINNLPDPMYFPSITVIGNYLKNKFYIKE